jgi:hypothetical protein
MESAKYKNAETSVASEPLNNKFRRNVYCSRLNTSFVLEFRILLLGFAVTMHV